MSITISFSMKPKKPLMHGQEWIISRLQKLARDLEKELEYCCDVIQDTMICQFCPEGYLWMGWNGGKLTGDCQTNIAGPGFHAAVIHFLELFASKAELKLHIHDDTGYYEDRDFVKMRREFFYQWFTGVMERVLEKQEEDSEQLVCWPADYYLPEEKEGIVTTHIRPFSRTEISGIVGSGVSMAFAKDFFIWNEEEKDAYYYRNCALVMLNQECYFMPSARSGEDQVINQKIIQYLERALKMNPRIPFPKKEYLELCRLAKHKPADLAQVDDYARELDIGCRKGLLFRTIGCIRFAVPGNFLYDAAMKGHSEHYYDGIRQDAHDYYICAIHTEHQADFQEAPFQKDSVTAVHEFRAGNARGKIAVYQPEDKDGVVSHSIAAQIIYKNQITIISIHYKNSEDYSWAMDLIQKVQTIS
ncbi:MAG: hypothetical protein ACRDBO_14010 [Lachnospiraceae bacterium]